jgi:hypothetical protein
MSCSVILSLYDLVIFMFMSSYLIAIFLVYEYKSIDVGLSCITYVALEMLQKLGYWIDTYKRMNFIFYL